MIKIVCAALAFVGLIVCTSYYGSYVYALHQTKMIAYTDNQYITNSNLERTNSFKSGQTLIMNFTFIRQPVDCYGDYVTTLTGKDAIFQWPMRRSYAIYDKVTTVNTHLALVIPTDMPEGDYDIKQLVFPTCVSMNLPAFDPGLVLKIHLTK